MTDISKEAVERMSPYAVDGGCDAYGQMEPDPFGDYVSFEAYESLRAELDRSEARVATLEGALRRCLNYIENTEREFGIRMECGDIARAALEDERKEGE